MEVDKESILKYIVSPLVTELRVIFGEENSIFFQLNDDCLDRIVYFYKIFKIKEIFSQTKKEVRQSRILQKNLEKQEKLRRNSKRRNIWKNGKRKDYYVSDTIKRFGQDDFSLNDFPIKEKDDFDFEKDFPF